MPQSAEKVLDHAPLFREPEYQEMLKNKKLNFECGALDATVAETGEWTKTWEYREKNLARTALVVNPAKACQPLGAVFAAAGFERTMSFVHGSQGCVAYYRSHLSRHFKEPASAVSSSMTEDAAVFGGLNNMIDGLANTYNLYSPKMIAVSTTCMAEVIGDDLASFIGNAKAKGSVPQDFDVPFAHTPAFVGSHVDGYDNMIKGVLEHFWKGRARAETPTNRINLIPGFDGYVVGNNRELKRLFAAIGADVLFISDAADQFDTPSDGEFRMYDGGTRLEDLAPPRTRRPRSRCRSTTPARRWTSPGSRARRSRLSTTRSAWPPPTNSWSPSPSSPQGDPRGNHQGARPPGRRHGRQPGASARQEIRDLRRPRLRLRHGPLRHGDGRRATHCLATNGNKEWEAEMQALLATSPFGATAQVWAGKDLWALRSLLFTEPVDFLIGNSYGKYLERDTGTPLIRLTFPVFDRHHHHRFPLMGYQGGLRILTTLLDKVFDTLDRETIVTAKTDYSYDLTR